MNESNKTTVSQLEMSDEGGINSDFKKAIAKKYKDDHSKVQDSKYLSPALTPEQANELFEKNSIKDCKSVIGSDSSTNTTNDNAAPTDGPITTSNWDVDAFVRNLHYWQDRICEDNGRGKSKNRKAADKNTLPNMYGRKKKGCGWCTSVINRSLVNSGFGSKYGGGEPWILYDSLKKGTDFKEIQSGETSNSTELPFTIKPLKGDICTMWKKGRIPPRHTCAFDGTHWVSDFIQYTCNVYKSSSPFTLEFHVFRHV